MNNELAFRQIHLDFHTSGAIEDVGADFDAEVFAGTLQKAHVNSINLFARCHHGWIYHDTQKFPERRHPHLQCNLLEEQMAACHARGIRTPLYISVQIDHYTAERHPEWRMMMPDGKLWGPPPYEAGFWRPLCLNTPYVDWLKTYVEEVLETLPLDGLWLDIVWPRDCSCMACKSDMLERGLEPADPAVRMQFAEEIIVRFQQDMSAFIRERKPDCLIFYNASHVGPRHREILDTYTHLELESLPSGFWGYAHYPPTARFARTLGLDHLGMTGKFHTAWGDFHSFKNQAALEYECFRMLALNGKCCVGDQLHPSGRICPHTYDLIGSVYEEVERKEPWCAGAEPVVEIGVLTPEEFGPNAFRQNPERFRAAAGATRMLEENAQQFNVLDSQSDFSPYKVLVLPDFAPVSDELKRKLDTYLDQGGALIASFASGMDPEQTRFTLDALGVELAGEGPRDTDGNLARGREYERNDFGEYLLPREAFETGLPATEHVMYMRGMEIAAAGGSKVLADVVPSLFDRSYKHFCSHRQSPSSGQATRPGIVQNGHVIYFSHPIFSQYQTRGPRWCRLLFLGALERLLPDPLVRVQAPTGTLATLNDQPEENRRIVHLLYYVPERRCEQIDVIEDVVPLFDIPVSVRLDGRSVERITCVPQGETLPFAVEDDRVTFTLPRLEGHQMVELAFG